jgi:hypothetical protein
MASTINASSAGIVETADNSGVLQLQTNGVQALNVDTSQNVTIPQNLTVNGTFSGNLNSISSSGNIISTGGYVECTNGGYSALQTNSVTMGNSTTGLYYNGSNALGFQINGSSPFGFGQTGTLNWNSYSIAAPAGSTTTFLRNDGTWAVPSGGSGGGASLSANQTFTGLNVFSQLLQCNAGSGYSALGTNSVEVGNANTGMYYNGSGAIGFTINSTGAFGITQSGSLIWGTGTVSAPAGSTSTYLRNDGTWVNPNTALLASSNVWTNTQTFTGTYNIFSDTYGLAVGGSSLTTCMIVGRASGSAVNYYSSTVGSNTNTSMYFIATGTALSNQIYAFSYNNPSGNTSTTAFEFFGDGTAQKTGGGSWSSISDARLKSNVAPLTGALAKIDALNPVSYTWNIAAEGEPTVGFIAQEVQKIIPNAVYSHTPTEQEAKFVDDRTLTIGWQADMTAYLVGAIKELSAEIEILKAKVGA